MILHYKDQYREIKFVKSFDQFIQYVLVCWLLIFGLHIIDLIAVVNHFHIVYSAENSADC